MNNYGGSEYQINRLNIIIWKLQIKNLATMYLTLDFSNLPLSEQVKVLYHQREIMRIAYRLWDPNARNMTFYSGSQIGSFTLNLILLTFLKYYLKPYSKYSINFTTLTKYKGGLKSSYDIIMSDDIFRPMRSKHFNTNKTSMCTARGTILKKKNSFGDIPWEYLGQPMNFSADPHFLVCFVFHSWFSCSNHRW